MCIRDSLQSPDFSAAGVRPLELLLGLPQVNHAGPVSYTHLDVYKRQEWQDVPEGVTVEFLADYEQVVGRDGKIYQPLRETTVKGIYKVTKGDFSLTVGIYAF